VAIRLSRSARGTYLLTCPLAYSLPQMNELYGPTVRSVRGLSHGYIVESDLAQKSCIGDIRVLCFDLAEVPVASLDIGGRIRWASYSIDTSGA
jgi:hypothetical protein